MKALVLYATLLVSSSSLLLAQERLEKLEDYISDYKRLEFEYDYRKNKEESLKLRDSWIAPLRINYNYSRSKPYVTEQINQSAAIRIDQPIFQSGGIIYGIKFANASKRYNNVTIDVAKRKLIKDTVATLMQIKQSDLREQKQRLQIENAEINLAQKQEEYLSGQLDSGFLDNAIIQKNAVNLALFDIQNQKERLLSLFHTLSDLEYQKAPIPHLELISAEAFLQHNIVLLQKKEETQKNRYAKNVRIAKYLPKISLTAGYNWSKTENQTFQVGNSFVSNSNELSYYDYGVSASWEPGINSFRDIESAKIDYLKSKVLEADKKRELKALYAQVLHNLENFDKKIALSQKNVELYSKLLRDTKELYEAGYKTEYDVKNLQNSLKIQQIDQKIYNIDKQLELLNLYEMYVNSGE